MQDAISPRNRKRVEDGSDYPESRRDENYPGKPVLSPLGL